jgi:DNA-binding transcriptional ArsR family regulator
MTSQFDCPSEVSFPLLPNTTEARAKIFAALADPTRLRIVELLGEVGELSSSEIAHRLDISLALLCHHTKILTEVGLLQLRKAGQTKFRSVNRELLQSCFDSLTDWDN